MLAPKIKPQGDNTYQFVTRYCADGSTQIKGIDFKYSYSPTASACSIRFTLCYAATNSLILGLMDVENCFQNVVKEVEKRVVVTTPPFFMQWFKLRYPDIKIQDDDGKYVLQINNGIQGDREIGREWYILLKRILEKFGCKQCPFELAVYFYKQDNDIILINTSTDDFLCAYSDVALFYSVRDHLKQYAGVTTQEGPELKYLNLRIVQSKYGASFDQTDHIQSTILDHWFPQGSNEKIKPVHTP